MRHFIRIVIFNLSAIGCHSDLSSVSREDAVWMWKRALSTGDLARATSVLEAHPDIALQSDSADESLLHKAAFNANRVVPQAIPLLVKYGADLNAENKWGQTPLWVAVQRSNTENVRVLLELGASVSIAPRSDISPLQEAAIHDSAEIIQLLVEYGAEVDHRRNNIAQSTALMDAAAWSQPNTVEALLKAGADPNLTTPIMTSVLHYAIDRESALKSATETPADVRIVQLLLSAGADVNAKDGRGISPFDLATSLKHSVPKIFECIDAARTRAESQKPQTL